MLARFKKASLLLQMNKKTSERKCNQAHYDCKGQQYNKGAIDLYFDRFSFQINKHIVVVLANARVQRSKTIVRMQQIWSKRGVFIFFLPPSLPYLNIIERL